MHPDLFILVSSSSVEQDEAGTVIFVPYKTDPSLRTPVLDTAVGFPSTKCLTISGVRTCLRLPVLLLCGVFSVLLHSYLTEMNIQLSAYYLT